MLIQSLIKALIVTLLVMVGVFGVIVYIATVFWLLTWALIGLDPMSGVYAIGLIALPPVVTLTYIDYRDKK